MKKSKFRFVFLVSILVIIIAGAIYLISPPGIYFGPEDGTTTRISLDPQTAKLGKPLTIRFTVDHKSPTPFYDILQFIPAGFIIEYAGISVPRPDLAYLKPGTNPVQFLVFNPNSTTHSYVITPNPSELCPSAPGTQITLDGVYLAPPEEPRTPLGSSSIPIQSGTITRTVSKSKISLNGEVTIYLHAYPACASSYTIYETIPSSLILTDAGNGTHDGRTLSWNISCSGICQSRVITYKMKGNGTTSALFSGQYSIGGSHPQVIQGDSSVSVLAIDCTATSGCGQIACQGEYCDFQQTKTCFNYECVNSCTGREDYYCGSTCHLPDSRYVKGDASCGSGAFCCQKNPTQSCEAIGGHCVFDESPPFLECPPGFIHDTLHDLPCNNGEIPLGRDSYPICCTP